MNNTYIQIIVIILTFAISYFYLKNKEKGFDKKSIVDKLKIPIVISCIAGLLYSFFINDKPTKISPLLGGGANADIYTDYPNF